MEKQSPRCPECGEEMHACFESGGTSQRVWRCHRCDRSQPRENAPWSVEDLLCAILAEQRKTNRLLERIRLYNEVFNVGLDSGADTGAPSDNENEPQIFDVSA